MNTFTVLPDLTSEQYQTLKSDIEVNGILVPVIRTDTGETIDGHHREKIAAELGITDIPVKIVTGLGYEERRHMAIRLNANRRQMTDEQKRKMIRDELKRTPDISNNWLAELLGVADKTVQAVRQEAEGTGDISKVTEFRCKDGKKRKYRRPARQQQVVAEVDLQESPALLSIGTTSHEQHAALPTPELGVPTILAVPTSDDIKIIHGDFRKLDLAPASARLILTDPPYDRDSMPLWEDLAVLADKMLVEGGVLLAYTGTMFLPETIVALSKTLVYRWTLAAVRQGPKARIQYLNMTTGWAPVLMFTKGKYEATYAFYDMIPGGSQEKEYHKWQKPVSESEHLIKIFTKPGDLVVDPFGGSFTSAVACKRQGRRCISCDIELANVETGHQRLKEVGLGNVEAA